MSEDTTICDKAIKIIDENKCFKFCYDPKKDAIGKLICNGSCIGKIDNNKVYVCNDLSRLYFKKYHGM